jgi:hypothetical protein
MIALVVVGGGSGSDSDGCKKLSIVRHFRRKISKSEKKNARDSPLTEKIEISGNYNGSDVGSGGSGSCYGVSGYGVSGVSSQ